MNPVTLCILFIISLVSQTPLIQALKSERSSAGEFKSIVDGAQLVISLDSGDAVIRRPRGSDSSQTTNADTQPIGPNAAPKHGGSSGEKRSKNGGHGNRKLSRNQDVNTPIGGRNKHHMDKKPLGSGEQQQHHQHAGKRQQLGNRQQHGNLKDNKQRQQLKSQQRQEHQGHQGVKRNNGQKLTSENSEHGNEGNKAQTTCRYTKSAWSDCDPRTNTHSRTLTLKKGDSNCLPTRTIQKKCKKACRYEKGTWTECKDGQMSRVDKLKTPSTSTSTTDSSCEASRTVNRKCNPNGNSGKSSRSHQNANGKSNKKERKIKDKTNNRGSQQA